MQVLVAGSKQWNIHTNLKEILKFLGIQAGLATTQIRKPGLISGGLLATVNTLSGKYCLSIIINHIINKSKYNVKKNE